MHPSALRNGKDFFDVYAKNLDSGIVLDIGSQNINGSLKQVCPKYLTYIGVDFVKVPGVDIVLSDQYVLPFPNNYANIVVSSSCFEHSEMFWLLFLEIMRVLKPSGIFYLNAPSNGTFHRHPVDCWRFYPDSGKALVSHAVYNKMNICLLESFTSAQDNEVWNDYVAVFLKDKSIAPLYKNRISDFRDDIENVYSNNMIGLRNYQAYTQNLRDYNSLGKVARQLLKLLRIKLTGLFFPMGRK